MAEIMTKKEVEMVEAGECPECSGRVGLLEDNGRYLVYKCEDCRDRFQLMRVRGENVAS